MFKVIDACNRVHDAYGTFVDEDGGVQFILCDNHGNFYTTNTISGFYQLYQSE